MTQLVLQGLQLRSHMIFANFYAGENESIVNYLQTDLWLKKSSIYLWGRSGSGRTHLLQAICDKAYAEGKSVMYLPLQQVNDLTPEILQEVAQLQVLCIDDIDCVLGKKEWEEALFHAYNQIQASGCIWVCAASVSARGLNCVLPDLQSRLSWGQVFHLQVLSEDERLTVLRARAKERGIIIQTEVLTFLLNHYQRDLGMLLQMLDKLDQLSLQKKKRITIGFVKEVLAVIPAHAGIQ